MQFVPGPDFPTGGILVGPDSIRQLYETGVGSLLLRGRLVESPGTKGTKLIVIRDIPYGLTTTEIIEPLAVRAKGGEYAWMKDLRFHSPWERGLDITIEVRKGYDQRRLLEELVHRPPLQHQLDCKMAVSSSPETPTGLLALMREYLEHRRRILGLGASPHDRQILRGELEQWLKRSDVRRTQLSKS